jgi:hypothetical protein
MLCQHKTIQHHACSFLQSVITRLIYRPVRQGQYFIHDMVYGDGPRKNEFFMGMVLYNAKLHCGGMKIFVSCQSDSNK